MALHRICNDADGFRSPIQPDVRTRETHVPIDHVARREKTTTDHVQWKPLIMITLGPALFDNNNRLITLSGGYKNLHCLTQFIVTTFTCIKNKKKKCLKTYVVLSVVCLHLVVPE